MKISVVIPAYNAERVIDKIITSLLAQTYKNKEIIIVDDESSDRTVEIAKKFKGVKVFARPHAGPAVQRNFGAKVAKGDIIFFTDSDCVAPKDLLKRVAENFKNHDIGGCGGTYKTLNDDSIMARYVGYEIAWRHAGMSRWIDFLGTYCCAYRRDIFFKSGGFEESFRIASGEDPDLSFRIAKAGHRLLFDRDMFVWHPHPETVKKYLRQQFWRAFWRVLLYRRHPEKIRGDVYTGMMAQFLTVFMLCFFVSAFLSVFSPYALYAAMVSLALFFGANMPFIAFSARQEALMLLFAPAIVFSRTSVWILGFLYGILKGRQ